MDSNNQLAASANIKQAKIVDKALDTPHNHLGGNKSRQRNLLTSEREHRVKKAMALAQSEQMQRLMMSRPSNKPKSKKQPNNGLSAAAVTINTHRLSINNKGGPQTRSSRVLLT